MVDGGMCVYQHRENEKQEHGTDSAGHGSDNFVVIHFVREQHGMQKVLKTVNSGTCALEFFGQIEFTCKVAFQVHSEIHWKVKYPYLFESSVNERDPSG